MFSEHFYFKMIYIIDHNSENEYSIYLIILMRPPGFIWTIIILNSKIQ